MADVKIYENTQATGFSRKNGGFRVTTGNGTVRCDNAVLAGNAYQGNLIPSVCEKIMPVGTYIGRHRPLGEAADKLIANGASVCDMNFVLDYFRKHSQYAPAFCARVSYSNITPRDLKACIKSRMKLVFPQLAEEKIEYAWGGAVAITQNRFPNIGRHGENIYYAKGIPAMVWRCPVLPERSSPM